MGEESFTQWMRWDAKEQAEISRMKARAGREKEGRLYVCVCVCTWQMADYESWIDACVDVWMCGCVRNSRYKFQDSR